jgi:hypothetical protein
MQMLEPRLRPGHLDGRGPTETAFRQAVLLLVGLLTGVPLWTAPARAQTIHQNFVGTDGTVLAEVLSGNTLYIGGGFNRVGPSTGSGVPISTVTGVPRSGFPRIVGSVLCAAADGAGGWYVGGSFTAVGGILRLNLVHVLANNSVASWNPTVVGSVHALAVSGGTVYVGGSFSAACGSSSGVTACVSRNNLAALDASTGSVKAWNPDANLAVRALAVSGGTVYVGGSFTTMNGGVTRNRLAAVDANTGIVTSWDPNANGSVQALAVNGGTVYVGGFFTTMNGGVARNELAAVDATTGLVTAWDPDPNANSSVRALAVNGGTVYVGGGFSTINGGVARNRLAAVNAATGLVTPWDPNPNGIVSALAVSGGIVYAGGDFFAINGGVKRGRLAAVDAITGLVTPWDPNASIGGALPEGGVVPCLAASGTNVFAGGLAGIFFGGVPRRELAAVDVVTGLVTAWDPDANSSVNAMAMSGGTVYVGGSFTTMNGGVTRNRLAAVDATTGFVTAWDPDANSSVSALAVNSETVYVGGQFTTMNGGATRNRLAAVDATTGLVTAWDPDAGGFSVDGMAVSGGTVYVGGIFTTINGAVPRNNLAAVDANTGLVTAWDPNIPPDLFISVQALVVSGRTVYVGGDFSTINGGVTRNNLAAVDAATGLVTPWDPDANSSVSALAVGGGTVYVGGFFSTINGGVTRNKLAAVDAATGLVTPWDPDADRRVFSLVVSGTRVYAGGDFETLGNLAVSGLAAIDGTFQIASLLDVGNDQGRQARAHFVRSEHDAAGDATPVLQYEAYRRVDPLPSAAAPRSATADAVQAGRIARARAAGMLSSPDILSAGWDFVGAVPAHGESEYDMIVPTLEDLTPTNSLPDAYSAFYLRAATASPATFYDTVIDSGYSVDNLPPPVPGSFVAQFATHATHLEWNASTAPDLVGYRIYRGVSPGFVPGPATRIATTTDIEYTDPLPPGHYYKLAAADVNGNESGYALAGPGGTVDVANAAPLVFALDGVRPNPVFGPALTVHFTLPDGSPARLELLDVTGRRVASRNAGALGAGHHALDLVAAQGLQPGIYFIRLTRGSSVLTARAAVLE